MNASTYSLFLLVVAAAVAFSSAFSVQTPIRQNPVTLSSAADDSHSRDDLSEMQCFIVNQDLLDEEMEGHFPEVVCTTAPEEYAWFNGIDAEALVPTDGQVVEGTVECVEGHSPRGNPVWECEA